MLLTSSAAAARAAQEQPPTLRTDTLGKEYRIYASPRQRLWSLVTGQRTHESHWALRNVSLELRRGQCLGLIGDNGAGKSSLLKLLAGTLQPSEGRLERHGRVTAILELGAGFHPDFTGRQNLYFGGSLIGIDAAQMRALEPEIIAFSELGDAIDRPIKTYSSGMVVRLAFALVTAVEPDLLIIDEALAVGDQHFQKKCVERIEAFRNHGCTILFCSHSLYHVQRLCDTSLWLHQGQVRAFGPTPEVIASYEAYVRARQASELQPADQPLVAAALSAAALQGHADEPPATNTPDAVEVRAGPCAGLASDMSETRAKIDAVEVADLSQPAQGSISEACARLTSPHLRITVRARAPAGECPQVGVMLEQAGGGIGITTVGTHVDGSPPRQLADGTWAATVTFPDLPLHTGEYSVSAYLFDGSGLVVYDEWKDCLRFSHVLAQSTPGLVRLPHAWS